MTEDQLKRGRDIQDSIRTLKETRDKVQHGFDYTEADNEAARTYIRVHVPSNSTHGVDIKDIDFNKEVLSVYIRRIDLKIVELEEEFKAL